MATVLSKLAVLITGSADGFKAASGSAKRELGGLHSAFSSTGAKITALAGGIGAAVAAAFSVAKLKGQFEAIDVTAKLSDKLGVATEELGRLQYAASYAGVSSEELAGSLGKFLKNLAEATSGSGPAAEALDALGLSAAVLVNESPTDAIADVADAMANLENPAQRAQAIMALFGKSGLNMIPLLQEGSLGLKEMGEEADKFGYSFSRVDAAQVEAANDAIQRVKNALEGVLNQLAIKLAPFIETAANAFVDWAEQGDGAAAKVVDAFEYVVKGVAYGADQIEVLKAAWYGFKAAVILSITPIFDAMAGMATGVDKLREALGYAASDTGTALRAISADLHNQVSEALDEAGKHWNMFASDAHAGEVESFFERIREASRGAATEAADAKNKFAGWGGELEEDSKAVEKVNDKLDDLRNKVMEFNLSDSGKLAAELERMGATKEQIAEGRALQDKLDAMEEEQKLWDKLADEAQKYYDDTRTDAEKYAAEIERINELLLKGALDEETAQRAADKAASDYAKSQEKKPLTFEPPQLLEAGSGAAANFVAELQAKARGADHAQQMVDLAKKGNKNTSDIARDVSRMSENGVIVQTASILGV